MRMGLEMKMSQQLIMTPQLQQAIKLLQLSRVELEDLIDQALVENPTLEVAPVEEEKEDSRETEAAAEGEDSSNLVDEQNQLTYDEEWQHYVESGSGVIQEARVHTHDTDEDNNPLEATISNSASLMDHLLWQLEISNFSELEVELCEQIIGNIDDEGYLSVSLRELLRSDSHLQKLVQQALQEHKIEPLLPAEGELDRFDDKHQSSQKSEPKKKSKKPLTPVDLEEAKEEAPLELPPATDRECGVLERLLRRIQAFDPPGVGARDLNECLQNQLNYLGLQDSLAAAILNENLQLLEQKDLKRIARIHKVEITAVLEAYQLITELEPKPGRPFGGEITQYVIPDVYIFKRGSEYVVSMNQESIPRLRINPYYQELVQKEMAKQKTEGKKDEDMTVLYIQEKMKTGDWLMKSIEQRQKTIFKVAKSILKYQYEFFEKGIDYLKPLVLKDVAEDIGVHESTVSRITTNKYIYTPQGIFELKYFFTSGIDQGGGDVVSSKKIKDYIKKMIDSEDRRHPFTDLQIKTELLKNARIKVARRTVAKYREAMNILPSNKRKQLF